MEKSSILIMPALYAGGAEKQYRYIIETANKEKSNLVVFLVNKPLKGMESETERFIRCNTNVEFHQLDNNVLNFNAESKNKVRIEKVKALLVLYAQLRKYIKKNNVDTVMFSYVTQLMLTPFFNKNGVNVVFNERNTGRQICDSKMKRSLLKKCHKVIANSNYAARYVQDKTGINVEVVKNGLVTDRIEKVGHTDFVILVPARLTPIKNQLVVLRALKIIGTNGLKVIFAGSVKDEAYYAKLKEYVVENDLEKCVSFPGHVSNMKDMYATTDLMILPSFEEGTPNVLLESYLYEIYPLVSDIPMNRDCCISESLLFSPDDADKLAEKIQEVMKMSANQKEEIASKGFQYVCDEYSMEKLAQNYKRILFDA